MITYTDGSVFKGNLAIGQVFVKGNREKTILHFNEFYMYYQTKTDIKNGTITGVRRSIFRKWLNSGGVQIKTNN